jgi:hypothetical protein
MDRPHWTSPASWSRLEKAVLAQPEYAEDALEDLHAMTARWSAARRETLLLAVADRALGGVPLPAAVLLALAEAMHDR